MGREDVVREQGLGIDEESSADEDDPASTAASGAASEMASRSPLLVLSARTANPPGARSPRAGRGPRARFPCRASVSRVDARRREVDVEESSADTAARNRGEPTVRAAVHPRDTSRRGARAEGRLLGDDYNHAGQDPTALLRNPSPGRARGGDRPGASQECRTGRHRCRLALCVADVDARKLSRARPSVRRATRRSLDPSTSRDHSDVDEIGARSALWFVPDGSAR